MQNVSEAELIGVSRQLHLSELAKQVARPIVPDSAADIIANVAPVRALARAVVQYDSTAGPLTDYLLDGTRSWALELSYAHREARTSLSNITLSHALEEESRMSTRRSTNNAPPLDCLMPFREALQEMGFRFTEHPKELRFKVLLGPVGCDGLVERKERAMAVYIYSPIFVPIERRQQVGRAIGLINWKLGFGGIEMDYQDGQVRFHYSLPLIGAVTTEHAHMMLGVSTSVMSRYAKAIGELALTDHDPDTVIAAAEKQDEEEKQMLQETEHAAAA